MKNNEEFSRLEQLVDALISRYGEQKEKFQGLEKRLKEREEECERLNAEFAELRSQRAEISSLIAGLLERLEQQTERIEPQPPDLPKKTDKGKQGQAAG